MNGNFDYNALLDTVISNKLSGSGKTDDKMTAEILAVFGKYGVHSLEAVRLLLELMTVLERYGKISR